MGRVVGRFWHLFAWSRRAMATRHMYRVLGDHAAARGAAREVFTSYGRYWGEALWARERRVERLRAGVVAEGLEHLLSARDVGTGMILALPHVGNWEVAAPVAVKVGVPVVAVAEKLANRRITEWFTAMRADFGIEIVLATGSIEVMRRLEAAIAENKAVALLSDRDLNGRGVDVEFFGERTTLPAGPASLSLRTGAPLLPVCTYFHGDAHRIVIEPAIPRPDGEDRGDAVRKMTQELATRMEAMIRQAPEQWHLVVPNWPSDRA